MGHAIPKEMRALILHKGPIKPGETYHPINVESVPTPVPRDGEILVKLYAAALNHRDVYIRQGLYPSIRFESVLGADGAGVVVGPPSHPLYNRAVIINAGYGWRTSPHGPDTSEKFGLLGGTEQTGGRGTFAEYIAVSADDVVPCPEHFLNAKDGWEQAAALPVAALTAWRAAFVKAEIEEGHNVLITGIGGGVAIQALQFAIAGGAKVFVTSGQQAKIDIAKKLGASGGVNYKDKDWTKQLEALLPKDRPYIDAVIDSAGGDLTTRLVKILRHGAKVAVYGQTLAKPHTFGMVEVLKGIEIRGSTLGSYEEFKDAIAFVDKHEIRPVVYRAISGLENAEEAFEIIKKGEQFGKVVISIASTNERGSKL